MSTSFLQSKAWARFQTAVGHRAFWFGDNVGYEHRLGPGLRYLYVPRVQGSAFIVQSLFGEVKKQGFIFVRIEPTEELNSTPYTVYPTKNRQPQHTLLIDLSQSDEDLLARMHAKTRYNIHLSERHGIVVREEKNIDVFWQLHEETVRRDKFRGHPKSYYAEMLKMPIAYQLTAYHGDTPIASHILTVYEDTCTYLHGASGNVGRNFMAPYLLQWRGIWLGKQHGCRWYDVWGVAPQPKLSSLKSQVSCFNNYCWDPTHPWSGITRFKAGFGGVPQEYPQSVDVVVRPMLYRIYQTARKAVRVL